MRRKLWEVADGGIRYWVSALDGAEALALVRALPDFEEYEGEPFEAEEMLPAKAEKVRFRFEDGETCSMSNAFDLVAEHSEVLACSEWP